MRAAAIYHSLRRCVPPALPRRGSGRLLAAALAALLAVAAGCQLTGEPEPQRPRTVTEFMKQPRPGEGVLGP